MRPFFPYYGSKWRLARLYPEPAFPVVVEPFAGSACYSLYWEPKQVILIDADPVINAVWNYLIKTEESEILALPDAQPGQLIDSLDIPQQAKWLMGFWANRGSAVPKKQFSAFSTRTEKAQLVWGPAARKRIADQQPKIREWVSVHMDYASAIDVTATWFIDPPYTTKGHFYRKNNVNYRKLGEWVKTRKGQVIACDHPSADYLPFQHLVNAKTLKGFSDEGVYLR